MNFVVEEIKEHRNLRRALSRLEQARIFYLQEFDSPATKKEYKRNLGEFIHYLRTQYNTTELSAQREHINAFKNYLLNNSKNSKLTINKKLSVVSGYFEYLAEKSLIEDNPAHYIRRYKRASQSHTRALSETEVLLLLEHIPHKTYLQLKFKTMCVLLFDIGMRIEELLTLSPDSIQIYEGQYVFYLKNKGGALHRVEIPESSQAYLGKYLEESLKIYQTSENMHYLFMTSSKRKIERKNFTRMLSSYAQRLGIGHVHPHMARATKARSMRKAGCDVFKIKSHLAHKSINTTFIYLDD